MKARYWIGLLILWMAFVWWVTMTDNARISFIEKIETLQIQVEQLEAQNKEEAGYIEILRTQVKAILENKLP